MTSDVADVLIIGAGASGGVAARELQRGGFSVAALEQGDWHDKASFRGTEWDWELSALKQWAPMPGIRASNADYPVDLASSDMGVLNFNGVGGGTILYNAVWPRFLPSYFAPRFGPGSADDWPFDYTELAPWYDEVDRQIGIAGMGGDPAYPAGNDFPLPPHPLSEAALDIARAFHGRGWHWWPGPNAVLSSAYGERRPCVQRGTCGSGCNEGAKSTVDATHWRPFVAEGGRLVTGARVARITLDDQGLANGCVWIDREGTQHFQPARVVLCAANGIGTPRLLLASACERFPEGLANGSGLVGRRLMLHPLATVTGYFGHSLQGWQGLNGSPLISLEFAEDDPRTGFRGGAKWSLHPTGAGPMLEAFKLLAGGVGPDLFHDAFTNRFGRGLMWSIMCEDLPDPENRVVLSDQLTDADGIPAPRLIYRTSDDARACLDHSCARAAEIFRSAGAAQIEVSNPSGYNAHFMGTARMGDDPSASVVDRWCMSHDIPNLGIIDGSVFVTSGAVNPTATICAIALRAARRLVDRRGTMAEPRHDPPAIYDLARPAERAKEQPASAADLTPLQKARLRELANGLVPPLDDLPGAGSSLVDTGLLARILSARPDLARPLAALLDDADDPADLSGLASQHPGGWMALLTAVAAGFALDPLVRARIGYEGQIAKPFRPDNYPAYVADGLLDHLLDGSWRAARDKRNSSSSKPVEETQA